MMRTIQRFLVCSFFLLFGSFLAPAGSSFDQKFLESFIKNYEFSPEGRYVHEYHPFLLSYTSHSFDQLEARLRDEGFNLVGRNVILGYEENAVPNYYTDYRQAKISDEASLKNKAGWSLRLHNRFGFMTGFLFKDLYKITEDWQSVYTHINAENIAIFDDRAGIFQEHAFGDALGLIENAQKKVMDCVLRQDPHGTFEWLIRFWEKLYSSAFRVGNKQVAGTQDIFFSIEAARHVIRSGLPLFKFFIGPDLTYPIEIFTKQEKEVTRNAQSFVKSFAKTLKTVDDKKTAYIFCSFVDGVGKSTMLGNIKNWMRFGDNVSQFGHVDNSSSQLAEVFQFKDNIYIADLPAQMSHFTYKPDGVVYVDAQTEYSVDEFKRLQEFVKENVKNLEKTYEEKFAYVYNIIKNNGFFDKRIYDPSLPDLSFIRNLFLLKKIDENNWIPFKYNDTHYLFNRENPLEIRFFTSLATVKSEGLKNIESEQMMFFEGIRFPLPYNYFLDDLVNKLKEGGVENVVFIDFMSMYPRSSRENIRINYLIQQMALLDSHFDVAHSLYKDFISGGELLHCMLKKDTAARVRLALKLESLIRLVLCKMIVERKEGDLKGIDLQTLTPLLHEHVLAAASSTGSYLNPHLQNKMAHEVASLEQVYGLSKSYLNVQKFSFNRIWKFSQLLEEYFTHHLRHDTVNRLWKNPGHVLPDKRMEGVEGALSLNLPTNRDRMARLLFQFSAQCKSEHLLAPMVRSLRASWYASLCNLIFTKADSQRELMLPQEEFFGVPLFVQCYNANTFHVVQPIFERWQQKTVDQAVRMAAFLFNVPVRSEYATLDGKPYRMNWLSTGTNSGIFAFTCDIAKGKSPHGYVPIVTRFVQKYQNDHDAGTVMPTVKLQECLQDSAYWQMDRENYERQAKRLGAFPYEVVKTAFDEEGAYLQRDHWRGRMRKIYAASPKQKRGIQRALIMLATLEMVLKDPEADVVVRDNNREDFSAALWLLEKVTLPKLGIFLKEDLFSDYDKVEPYPSWEFWDEVEF
ncbi:hypothetical protein K2X40_01965 [Candidatus Babeliales bacterium]|nr:hypothetical protein [Candidatus Babeliales bacterium]